ncbi:MAG: glycosyltransferase [Nocardioides sp.]
MTEPARLTVLFLPESAYGPTNQCIGLGKVLLDRGHRVVFAAERSWAGKLAPMGFVEALVDLAEPDPTATDDAAGQFWIDFINQTAPEFRKPTVEQLASFVQPTYQALIDGAKFCEPQLRAIIAEHRPDVLVEDNVVAFPALLTSGAPYVRIVSCNPLEVRGDDIAPVFSGYAEDDRSDWPAFLAEFDRTHRDMWADFDAWVQERGAPPLPDRDFIHTSAAANLYVYPEALDYVDRRPLGETWHRLASSVRETDEGYELPAELRDRPEDSALIYLSLGSLGGADIELLQRLVDLLGTTRHRVVVSMGPRAEEIRLADTMTGAAILPQTRIIPLVDLVITHGGNNTTTEAMHFGKPMLVLPLFWDQYDNAQRVDEKGFGRRLATYAFADEELLEAVEELLADDGLRAGVPPRASRSGPRTACGAEPTSSRGSGWTTSATAGADPSRADSVAAAGRRRLLASAPAVAGRQPPAARAAGGGCRAAGRLPDLPLRVEAPRARAGRATTRGRPDQRVVGGGRRGRRQVADRAADRPAPRRRAAEAAGGGGLRRHPGCVASWSGAHRTGTGCPSSWRPSWCPTRPTGGPGAWRRLGWRWARGRVRLDRSRRRWAS